MIVADVEAGHAAQNVDVRSPYRLMSVAVTFVTEAGALGDGLNETFTHRRGETLCTGDGYGLVIDQIPRPWVAA